MESSGLFNIFIFLVAACAVVPLATRFKLGAVLGYLLAGVLIGPYALGFIGNVEEVMHFAEFGVVMMLFLIGLELDPSTLWRLRRTIVGLGGAQVVLTSAVFTGIGLLFGFSLPVSLAVGMALSLSSTAIVLQMLEEKNLLRTAAGESTFSVLLFQDISVIFILILLPLLAVGGVAAEPEHAASVLEGLPAWQQALAIAAVIAAIVFGGRYLSSYIFDFVARTRLREVTTATSLALVVGTTLLMYAIGLSPALGAFLAGVVLANSEYKHSLETDIQPFKGLLLGLFFISVGMGVNFDLMVEHPFAILGLLGVLVTVKILLLLVLGRFISLHSSQNIIFAFGLCQGSEFAFVLFQYSQSLKILTADQAAMLTLVVALSMAATPLLVLLSGKYLIPRFMSVLPPRQYDNIEDHDSEVIIAGYGRYGQIIGRFLKAQGIRCTILEKDPDQIQLLRQFGTRVYYGDASREDLLRAAGAHKAKLLVITLADSEKCVEIVRMAKREFPNLKVLVRAQHRRHAYELHKAGADYYRRELFDSSLTTAQQAIQMLGVSEKAAKSRTKAFREHDEKTLRESFDFYENEAELINFTRSTVGELEKILQDDMQKEEV